MCICMHDYAFMSEQAGMFIATCGAPKSTSTILLALYITYICLEIRVYAVVPQNTCRGQRQLAEVSFLLYYAGPKDGRLGDRHLLRYLVSPTFLRQGMSTNQEYTNSA